MTWRQKCIVLTFHRKIHFLPEWQKSKTERKGEVMSSREDSRWWWLSEMLCVLLTLYTTFSYLSSHFARYLLSRAGSCSPTLKRLISQRSAMLKRSPSFKSFFWRLFSSSGHNFSPSSQTANKSTEAFFGKIAPLVAWITSRISFWKCCHLFKHWASLLSCRPSKFQMLIGALGSRAFGFLPR